MPRPRFKSYAELNAWLMDRCIAWAKAHPHPELRDKNIWEVFEAERPSLVPYVGPFDGFHAVPARAHCPRTNGEQGHALEDLFGSLRQ